MSVFDLKVAMTKATRKKQSTNGKKPTTKKTQKQPETKLTGAEATDLYSSLNDSIFQDSFDKFVGDRETRRKQLNLRADVRASFNRDSSLEYSTNDDDIQENTSKSYRYSICSTPHTKFVNRNLDVSFPGVTPNSQSKAYNSSDLFESYAESERNGTHVETITTNLNHKQNEISTYTVCSSVIESSVLHGSEANANMNADETNGNICGTNAEINNSKQSSSSSNSSLNVKRKVSSKKQISSYKWKPYVTTRKHQKLKIVNGAKIFNSLDSLDNQKLDSISMTSQSSVKSNYINPVRRNLRSSSLKNKLANSSNSAHNFSSAIRSLSTDTSSHSSSNMSSRSGLSETQNSSFTFASVSQVAMDLSSESKASSHKIKAIDFNQNSTQELSGIKYDEISQGDIMSTSISIQNPLAEQSHDSNKVGRILRSSTKRIISENGTNSSKSQDSSVDLVIDLQENDCQVYPYQENATIDTSIAGVRMSTTLMSPPARRNIGNKVKAKKPPSDNIDFPLKFLHPDKSLKSPIIAKNSVENLPIYRFKENIEPISNDNKCSTGKDESVNLKLTEQSDRANKCNAKKKVKSRNPKDKEYYIWPTDTAQTRQKLINNVMLLNDSNSLNNKRQRPNHTNSSCDIPSISTKQIAKEVTCTVSPLVTRNHENTISNESTDKTKVNKKSVDAHTSKPFQDITNSFKENLSSLKRNQGELRNFDEGNWTIHDQNAVSSSLISANKSRRTSKENNLSMTNDPKCSTGKEKSVNCNDSNELELKNEHVMYSNNVTLRKCRPANVNKLPVIMESIDLTNEDIATENTIRLTSVTNEDIAIENTIRLKSGKWRRHFSLYRRQTLSTQSAFILEQTDVVSTNQLKISLPNESHRQTLRHSVSFNLSRDNFVDFNETSDRRAVRQRRTSALNPLGVGRLIDSEFSPITYTARDTVLRKCQQSEPLEFDEIYSESVLRKCRKIGEGVYGEVFMNKTDAGRAIVLKVIPIEGFVEVNGEQQKKFDEILSEIIIALELSSLRNDKEFMTSSFTEVVQVRCVQGRYPQHLIDLWELYRENSQTENDHPEIFTDDQLYIVLELAYGGQDLEAFHFTNALQSKSAFQQTTLALAVAEKKFQFEHRDLHWGNILLAPTDDKFINFKLNGNLLQIPSEGIKVTIIDYTLSRMRYEDIVLYNDLSNDDELFTAHGDYQFDIYRLMKSNLENDWRRFEPFNNVLWLHYIADKLINGARYKNRKSQKHRAAIEQLMVIRDELTNYKSAEDSIAIE